MSTIEMATTAKTYHEIQAEIKVLEEQADKRPHTANGGCEYILPQPPQLNQAERRRQYRLK